MARALWTGAINFGLVTIPVKLTAAVRPKELHFNLLHEKDMGPIHNERICNTCGAKVSWKELVRGFRYQNEQHVVVTDDDLKKASPEATQSVDIVAFAHLAEIDPLYFDTPYYLEPEKRGRHAYALLREALARSERVGIARVVLRTKQHLAVVKPHGSALVLELMHWADEVAPLDDLELPEKVPLAERAPEMKAALMLIDAMTREFHAADFHDEYREHLLEVIGQRAEGRKAKGAAPTAARPTNVVDLMNVLKQSLAAAKTKTGSHTGKKHTPKAPRKTGRRTKRHAA